MSANIEVPANVSDAATLNGSTAAEIQAAAETSATATAREQNIAKTGFGSWGGTGNYYSVTGNTLTLLRPATGSIDGIEVTCAAGQSADLVQYACTYFGFDANGVFGAVSDSNANEAWYRSHVSLFQALWDGTSYKVVFENHPRGTLQGDSAVYLHHVMRSVLGLAPGEVNEIGANITRVTTGSGGVATDRQLKIVGNAALYDHGVVSVISDTAGAAINPYFAYTDASGRWKAYAQQQSFPMVYNNAGTVTALGAGNYSIMAVYVTKNDPNDGATFIVVIGTGNYSNSGQAETALANNQVPKSTNELNRLEVALLGYVIVHNSGGGYIHTVQIEKQVAGAAGMGGGVGGSAALTLVSHTAVNYTADSQTVEGHIAGIDAALLLPVAAFKINSVTASTATTAIDLSNGHKVRLTLGASTTVNFTNPPASGYEIQADIRLIQDATGSRTISAWQVAGGAVTPDGDSITLTGTALSEDYFAAIISNVSGTYSIRLIDIRSNI